MTIMIIGLLVGLSGYLGARLHATSSENTALRASVASLKKRLNQR